MEAIYKKKKKKKEKEPKQKLLDKVNSSCNKQLFVIWL